MTTDTADAAKTHKFKLSTETVAAIDAAVKAINDEIGRHQDEWNDKTEQWQESQRGEDVDSWLSVLNDFAETMDEPPLEPEYS